MFGSSGRGEEYATESAESQNLTLLSEKLANDLRNHVRKLQPHGTFSPEWVAMVESLQYVAGIAAMEERLPKRAGAGEEQTLWEGEELAIRYIMEEGKLNMILRILHEYKTIAINGGVPEAHAKAAMAFEQHAGTLLRCSITHTEAIQVADMPELCEHMGAVLGNLLSQIEAGTHKDYTGMQEVQVVYYLGCIGDKFESLPEDRTMLLFCDHGVTSKVVRVLSSPDAIYDRDCLMVAAKALSAIVDSEHFQTHKEEHFPDPEDFSRLVSIQDKFLAELCKDAKFRISIRPLADFIRKEKAKR